MLLYESFSPRSPLNSMAGSSEGARVVATTMLTRSVPSGAFTGASSPVAWLLQPAKPSAAVSATETHRATRLIGLAWVECPVALSDAKAFMDSRSTSAFLGVTISPGSER